MMASGSSKKRSGSSARPPVIRQSKGLPWLTIIAVALVVVLAGAITWVVLDKKSEDDEVASFLPTAENRDPSVDIEGIYVGASVDPTDDTSVYTYPAYKAALHVTADQRVAYDRFPPVGGPHDGVWANCEGTVYPQAVRDENMVHTLEHGAIWIAYNPDVSDAELATLKSYVEGESFISLSPYPGLKKKVSLQAWAHQLQVDTVDDPRIREFITALRRNAYVYPETGASCASANGFDVAAPPAFDGSPRSAEDIQMDGKGAEPAASEEMVEGTDAELTGSDAEATGSGAATGAADTGAATGSPSADASDADSTGSGSAESSADTPTS